MKEIGHCICGHHKNHHYNNLMFPNDTHCSRCKCKHYIKEETLKEEDKK